ncbi:hypothetical protein [Oceanicoccus sagamiensis]|uniref:GTPase n=1 Tax=Oceanicoccus sagamiensis TaxID=716816 RepID=A0A1X9NF31_9GAMM|nr:hypothetical protein [Oceanicoccus sagamiensis]ARN73557.1 hypothetical protein BST96_05145 [Oceanicoccus sagamiensis]
MSSENTIRLKVPRQELEKSSFFADSGAAVDLWVANLPMANLGQSTRQLYQALAELNRVRMLPNKRFEILEKLRTSIYFVSKSLTRHYINQPIVLPEQPRKVAILAHTLHQQLATGYTIVATHTAALGKRAGFSKPESLIAQALHRAITDHTINMQRHYQLYEPINKRVWNDLHQFYALARQQHILDTAITDTEFGDSSVENCYKRALLIGCCKPNQLRQEDLLGIFKPLTEWASLCPLGPTSNDGLFIIDPTADKPPVYRELFESALEPEWLSLDTQPLAQHLKKLREDAKPDSLKADAGSYQVSIDLLGHLILAWDAMSKRTFMRLEANDELELCVGLSATHHFVSGELSFESLVEERGAKTFTMQAENPFMKVQAQQHRNKDVWDSPYEANMGQTSVSLESIEFHIRDNEQQNKDNAQKYRSHSVQMLNSSAHGYCVEWPPEAEAFIKTGEIVGIKEANSHNWSIAVIRWVKHGEDKQTQMGLELISPSAAPYGARIVRKTGAAAEYMRVLVLPEVAVSKQPITLLTPRVPFKTGFKVVLNQRGKEVQATLTKKLNETGAYNQFEFKRLGTPVSDEQVKTDNDDLAGDDFDSLWGNL